MTAKRDGGSDNPDDPAIEADGRWTQVAQRHYDPDRDPELTAALVYAIADAEGICPTDLKSPQLYEIVDAAALEETYFGRDAVGGSRQGVGTTEFRYGQYLVKVRSDGWIQVYVSTDNDMP